VRAERTETLEWDGFACARRIYVVRAERTETLEWDGFACARRIYVVRAERDLVIFIAFEAASISATISAMLDPTELRWKVRPGNSFS